MTVTTHVRELVHYSEIEAILGVNTGAQLAGWAALHMLPVGTIAAWVGSSAPDHWAILNGQNLSRTGWADIFDLWGTTFGNGDGSTTFGTPDLGGRILMGAESQGTVSLGGTAGSTTAAHTHSGSGLTMASHTHDGSGLSVGEHQHGAGTLAASSHTHGPGSYTTEPHSHSFEGSSLLATGVPLIGGDISEEQPAITGTSGEAGASCTGSTAVATASVSGETGSASPGVSGTTGESSPSIVPPVFGVHWIVYGGINGGVEPPEE